MTNNSLIDPSLAEVWEWRTQLRLACQGMSAEEKITYLHRRAEQFVQNYGFELVPIGNGQSMLQK
jgi:hypothetical protein